MCMLCMCILTFALEIPESALVDQEEKKAKCINMYFFVKIILI